MVSVGSTSPWRSFFSWGIDTNLRKKFTDHQLRCQGQSRFNYTNIYITIITIFISTLVTRVPRVYASALFYFFPKYPVILVCELAEHKLFTHYRRNSSVYQGRHLLVHSFRPRVWHIKRLVSQKLLPMSFRPLLGLRSWALNASFASELQQSSLCTPVMGAPGWIQERPALQVRRRSKPLCVKRRLCVGLWLVLARH